MIISQTFDYKNRTSTYRFPKKALLQTFQIDEEQLKKLDSDDVSFRINSRYIYMTVPIDKALKTLLADLR
jgi:hypothetical protein